MVVLRGGAVSYARGTPAGVEEDEGKAPRPSFRAKRTFEISKGVENVKMTAKASMRP